MIFLRALAPAAAMALAVCLCPLSGQAQSNAANPPAPFKYEIAKDIAIGYQIAPVKLNLAGKDPALVGLGAYLVTAVTDCNGCHTNPSYAPGGDPAQGQPKQINVAAYLAGGQGFGPSIISRNITPDVNGLPGGRTWQQFLRIMRTGFDFDHAHPQYGPLLQVMPWPAFQNMTDHELLAIYTYLSAIPSLPNNY